jgi:hypothetical protein
MVMINKPMMAAAPLPPTNQHVVDMLYQNDEMLKRAILDGETEMLRRYNGIADRMEALEQSVKAIEQLLQELINKE